MAFWAKKDANTWAPVKALWVKNSSSIWKPVKKVFVKTASGFWTQFFPKSGPYANDFPYFSYSNGSVDVGYEYVGNTIYGNNGTWNSNGYTITSYTYNLLTFSSAASSSATSTSPSGTYSSRVPITLSSATYDGKYIAFQITANTSTVSGVSSSESGYDKLAIIRQNPVIISKTFNTNTPTDGSTLTYSSVWNTTDLYLANSTRRKIEWYKSKTGTYSTSSQIRSGATFVKSSTNPSSSDLSVTVGSPTTDVDYYYYVIETQYNSGTDYINGTSIGVEEITASSIVVSGQITQTSSPTISGSGIFGGTVTASAGAYQNYKSLTTRVWGILSPGGSAPTDGVTSLTGGSLRGTSSSYVITQSDVTAPIYLMYALDAVIGYDNVTKYYFSKSYITPYVGNFTDNFNRTVSSGLGQSSYGLYWYGTLTNGSWRVDGSKAVSSTTPTGGAASGYELYAMDMGTTTDRQMSVQFPVAVGGLGLCWWVTDSNNWWASAVYQYATTNTATTYSCNGTSGNTTSCTVTSNWQTSGGTCYCGTGTTTTTYSCDGTSTAGLSSCTVASNWSASSGVICSCTTQTTSTTHFYCDGGTGTLSSPCTVEADTQPYAYCYCDSTGSGGTTTYAFASGGYSYGGPGSSVSTCNAANVGKAQTGSTVYVGGGYYTYNICSSTTTAKTYAYRRTSTSNYTTSSTTYTSQKTSTSTSSTSYPYQNTTSSTTTTTNYNSNIRIFSSAGSSVTVVQDDNKHTSTTTYAVIWGMKVTVSGSYIFSSIYSDQSLNTQIGSTSIYNASGATRKDPTYGTSGAGMFVAPSTNQGTYFDNLAIS
jgi:hypothetical protein